MFQKTLIVFMMMVLINPVFALSSTKNKIGKKQTTNTQPKKQVSKPEQKVSTPSVSTTSVPITVVKKQKTPITIFACVDFGSVNATGSGYKTENCKIPTSYSFGVEYELGKFEKIEYGIGIRYLPKRKVSEFKTEFSMIPIYGYGSIDIGNNLVVNGRVGYEIPDMKTKVSGKWTGDFCYGIGIGWLVNEDIKVVGDYSFNNAKYTLDDFTMNWSYNLTSFAVQYTF